jgi:hypothetical protein
MVTNLPDLIKDLKNYCSIVNKDSIRMEGNELCFTYAYLDHLPDPFSGIYDPESKTFYLEIKRDAFPFGSSFLEKRLELPKDTDKIKVKLIGEPVNEFSAEQRIEHFFPKLRKQKED